jgi:hypothetical protein
MSKYKRRQIRIGLGKKDRNPNGTFKKGHTPLISPDRSGRPPSAFSARAIAKAMAEGKLELVIANLYKLAMTNDVAAIDKIIKLNGGYDPVEVKDISPASLERPLKGLTVEELKKLLGGGDNGVNP